MKSRFSLFGSEDSPSDNSKSDPARSGPRSSAFDSGRNLTFPTLGPAAAAVEEDVFDGPIDAPEELGAQSTDVFGAFSACKSGTPCNNCPHRPTEIQQGGAGEALLTPVEAASWLHTLEAYEGYWLVEWRRADGAHPIHLIVGEGRVFYGLARRCHAWLDGEFRSQHPQLAEAYQDYIGQRRTDARAISMKNLLIDLDVMPVRPAQRQALLEHLARALAPGTEGQGRRWRLDPQAFREHRYLSFQPVEVLAAIGAHMCPVDDLRGELDRLNIQPDERWLFARDGNGCGSLIFTNQSVRDGIGRIADIAARTESLMACAATTPAVDQEIFGTIGIDGDEVWLCLTSAHSVALTRHPALHLGRLCRLLQTMRAA